MDLKGFWIKGFAILSGRVTFGLFRALRVRPYPAERANLSSLDTRQYPDRENLATGQQTGRSGVGVWYEATVNFIGR
jgi:hypothetical protein